MTAASYSVLSFALIGFMLLPQRILLPGNKQGVALRLALLIAIAVILVIPFTGTRPVEALRATTGDFSITTLVLLITAAWRRIGDLPPLPWPQTRSTLLLVLVAAVLLYPAGLGMGQWDPYRLGFGLGLPLFAALAVVAALSLRHYLTAFAISAALLAFGLRLLESENLWDYLLDPWLTVYAIVKLAPRPGRKRRAAS
jgi:hypothetical protein